MHDSLNMDDLCPWTGTRNWCLLLLDHRSHLDLVPRYRSSYHQVAPGVFRDLPRHFLVHDTANSLQGLLPRSLLRHPLLRLGRPVVTRIVAVGYPMADILENYLGNLAVGWLEILADGCLGILAGGYLVQI